MDVKLAPDDNADAPARPASNETMLANNNMEPGNNDVILSNPNHRGHARISTDDNHELNETDIDDDENLSTSTIRKCNSKEGNNNNNILSNQQINTLSSKRQNRMSSVVSDHDSWYTSTGIKKTPHGVTNNSADHCFTNINKNNVSNRKNCETGLFQNRTVRNITSGTEDDNTHGGSEYTQPNEHISQPQVSLETEYQGGSCPTTKPTSHKVNTKSKAPPTISSRITREVDAVFNCKEPSRLSMTLETKRDSLRVHEDCGENCAETMDSLSKDESVKTKNTAIIKVNQEININLPDYLKTLAEGKSVCGDTHVSFSKPDWFDMEKFQRGQHFAINHIFGVMFAELMSLMILFAFRGGLEPLIFTGKSDTPFKSFKRYLSTITRIKTWYEGDIWDVDSAAHKNLKAVRGMHDAVRKSMEAVPEQEVAKRLTLENQEEPQPIWTDLHEEILDDFRSSCPFSGSPMASQKEVHISQFDMAMTQFGFMGLIVLFPKMFGVHYASDQDLEGFSHFWRTIGYLLGTEDRFNMCSGDLKTVRQRCRDIIDHWVRPSFRDLSRDWIHMCRCVYKGVSFYVPNVKFEIMLLYLCRVLDIKAVKLAASFSFWDYFIYFVTIFLYWFTFRLPGMWRLHNWLINFSVKFAVHMTPERLTKLEQRVHTYETCSSPTSARP